MKGLFFAICAAASLMGMADEKIVASWDFEKGLDSGDIKMAVRGTAALVDEEGHGKVLRPAAEYDGKPAGLILKGATRPDVLPEVFTWSMDVKYQAPDPLPPKGVYTHLLDCRYNKPGGMNWLMLTDKAGNPMLKILLGTSEGTASINAKASALADGKWHTLKLVCKEPKLELFIDGKSAGMAMLKGKPLPPAQRLTIGDRVGSSYSAFRGLIDNVVLSTTVNNEAGAEK